MVIACAPCSLPKQFIPRSGSYNPAHSPSQLWSVSFLSLSFSFMHNMISFQFHSWKWKCSSLSHVWLWDPVDCSSPGSSVHGVLQARILEWVAMPSSRGSSWPKDWTRVSCIAGGFFTAEPPGKPSFWSTWKQQVEVIFLENVYKKPRKISEPKASRVPNNSLTRNSLEHLNQWTSGFNILRSPKWKET